MGIVGRLSVGGTRFRLPVSGGSTPTPPATYLEPATSGSALMGTDSAPITAGQGKQDTVHQIRGATSSIVLTLAGVHMNTMQGEQLLPSYTWSGQVIPTSTGTPINVTLSGSTTITVGASDVYVDTDPIAFAFADGDTFTVRELATGATLPALQPAGTTNSQLYTDEALQTAASGLTLSGAPTDSLNRRRRMCTVVAVSRVVSSKGTTVACIGDSIMAYQTSTLATNSSTADHLRGDVVRSLGQYYACYNLGIGADQPSSALFTNRALQRMLARRCTFMFDEYGINEVENRAMPGDQAWAYHLRMRASFPGLKYVHSTLVPRTTGTYTSEAGQTADATKTPRINAYNVLALAAADQTWNRRALVQGTNTDVWAAPGSVASALDGLHPTLAGQDLIIADKLTGKAKVDAASVIPANDQPALTLTLTNTPTFSGGKFVRGTATGDGMAASGLPSSAEFYGNATAVSAFDVYCGTAGRLFINSSGIPTYTRSSSGTQYQAAVPASIVGTGEHFFRIVTINGTTNVYMDDIVTPLITATASTTSANTGTRIVATATNAAGTIRDLTSWAADRTGAATPSAGAIPAVQTGMVGYWPLATDGSGVFGPWLGSL